ncbi:MAG: hypothetical protein KF860_00675 [Cyclobacteriaceae bacterium]|nr:hypothetical protein [Cyclobacteriaceae bacterium]
MKLSNKDLVLLFGILIAVIVALTTIMVRDHSFGLQKTNKNTLQPTTSFASPEFLKGFIEKIEFHSPIR